MKKIIPIITIAAIALVMVFSCTKEEISQQKVKSNDPEAIKAYNRIIDFKSKVAFFKENPAYKSGELISLDSLLWDFNAALNFDYSKVDDPYKQFYSETVFSELTITTDNFIDIYEALSAYLEIETEIQNTLEAAPFNEKAVQFTFVKVENIEEQTLTLRSSIAVGEKGTDGTGPFSSDQDWMYGDNYGMCSGQYYGIMDGGDAIETMVETRRHLFINDQGINVIYVNPVQIILDKDDIDNNPILDLTNGQGYDNTRDYRIFYAHSSNCPQGTTLEDFECIYDGNMNFYNNQMEYLIYNMIPNNTMYWPQADHKKFVRFNQIDGRMLSDENDDPYLIHIPYIIFADRKIIEL
ncbi:MAG: hypothetical protein FJY07_04460 [Bacteroidetes bacterium]|nr:hypothetical protein [Bacteroidota bacterium]